MKIAQKTCSFLVLFLLCHCSRELKECNGPTLDTENLKNIRQTLFDSGPRAALVVPNPIDASEMVNIQTSDQRLASLREVFQLPELLNPSRLDGNLLKIRLHEMGDSASILAKPNAQGNYEFNVSDVHYSETLAYHSMSSILQYVENLGFSVVRTRPFYVMVNGKDPENPSRVNAIYTHNYFSPSKPRTLYLYGETAYAPGKDRDVYWHEFGHFLNESVTRESGMDYAGDSGAVFTEGAALHECLADYFAESLSDRPFIGRWLARNFSSIPVGEPLRTAEISNDGKDHFSDVAIAQSNSDGLDRYAMAEWCTRVMWSLRTQIAKEDPGTGALFADRLILSAVSQLGKDTSVSHLKSALKSADESLHCGLHSRSIDKAFEDRGFTDSPSQLSSPLTIKGAPLSDSSGLVAFQFTLSNTTGGTARNVRVFLESPDASLTPVTYMQGFGDVPTGRSISVGSQNGGMPLDFSVTGTKKGAYRYRLRVRAENAPDGVYEGSSR